MYYLFIHKKSELQKYKSEFDRVLKAIEEGKTPVQNELRLANTVLFESFPYQILSGIFLVVYNELLCQHKKIHRFKVYKLYSLFVFQFIALEGFIHFIRYTVI